MLTDFMHKSCDWGSIGLWVFDDDGW